MSMNQDKKQHALIGARLRWIRVNLALVSDQKKFAEKHNWESGTVSTWELGKRRLLPESAELYCDSYGVTMDFIYRGITSALPQNIIKLLSDNPLDK